MRLKYLICSFVLAALACLPAGLSAQDVPGNALDKVKKPLVETPSGTQPAQPATPGENPATPAEPGDKEKPDTDKDVKDNKEKPEDTDKDQKEKDSKDEKDKKDKTDKDLKDKKDRPGKSGKSGGKSGGSSAPSAVSAPQAGAAGAIGGGILGGIFSGGKKDKPKEEKKEKTAKPAPEETAVSSEPAKAAPVQVSTPVAAAEPLFSAGEGAMIAVIDFEGEMGAEFAALLAKTLGFDLKVYNPAMLAAKQYSAGAITRISAKKIAAELGVDYLVTGKVSKKTETLSMISILLRDGRSGDTKLTDNQSLRSADGLTSCSQAAADKIREKISSFK